MRPFVRRFVTLHLGPVLDRLILDIPPRISRVIVSPVSSSLVKPEAYQSNSLYCYPPYIVTPLLGYMWQQGGVTIQRIGLIPGNIIVLSRQRVFWQKKSHESLYWNGPSRFSVFQYSEKLEPSLFPSESVWQTVTYTVFFFSPCFCIFKIHFLDLLKQKKITYNHRFYSSEMTKSIKTTTFFKISAARPIRQCFTH